MSWSIWGILQLLLLLHALTIPLLVFKIVLQRRESGATLAWILVVIFLPFLGLLLFWLLGSTRIKLLRRKRHRAEARLTPSLERLRSQEQLTGDDDLVAGSLYSLATRLDECGPQPGCRVEMCRDAEQIFNSLESAIDAAEHHIHLMFYIWEADTTGQRFCQALTRAAQRGVEVRLLVDDVGSYLTKTDFFHELVVAGGEVARFLPLNLLSRQVSVNNRNHRKIIVIDGTTAFTGSMNIGDLYAGLSHSWSDLLIKVEGLVVNELQSVFCQDWHHSTGKDLATEQYFPSTHISGDVCAHFLASGPSDDGWRAIYTLLFVAINSAQERVWIETPYFVPDPPILMSLQSAALRGLDVRLLLPQRSDHIWVDYAGRSFFDELLHAGVRLFTLDGTISHAKTVIVDRVFASAGSANMDQRSFRLNFEGNLMFFGKKIATELADDFLSQSQPAQEIDLASRAGLSHRERLKEGFARILAPLL
ncbi:cardiolipin synthase [Malonomonas rubra DSM 5091]|uniref:Cardiolipin synthase n=1 Tax=Malonomonas rubra DSM 5091 TaxID=1122189 RepID=A0A1M6JCI3_MALRU|nr:cardiolipin synthase [Malonomonas rubra]SHJ44373.1 cardiolipin synthase [Malonomonas rubra DSM 5091]